MARLKFLLFCLALLLMQQFLLAADTAIVLNEYKNIKGNFSNFAVDNLGNIYLVSSQNNQIKKLGPQLDSLAVFNDVKRFGNIDLIDVSNPLKILLYYKNYATILVLDRFLNIRSTIDLRKAGILQAKAITLAYDNNIWIFDELDASIRKIDEQGRILQSSADFRILFSNPINPNTLFDKDGSLYLYDPNSGLYVFDYYGALKHKQAILNWQNTQVMQEVFWGVNQKQLCSYTKNNLQIHCFNTNTTLHNKSIITNNKIYVLSSSGIIIYTTTQ